MTLLADTDLIAISRGGVLYSADLSRLVETGSGANGTYNKYPDGRLECFHEISLGSVTANGAGTFSSPYYSNAASWTFPHVFIATPNVSLTPEVPVGVAMAQRLLSANYFSRDADSLNGIRIYRDNDNTTADSVTVLLRAWGRWKV